ncbi:MULTISPECIES: glycosyltransferase family 4 protein [unclassified Knoellia]|uniref:glycosyltransferase family 4 protein n=1 Tax=Knoellia altitudinis TaxID=3404795 RepID=UPI0036186A54
MREVAGAWPGPDDETRRALGTALADIPAGAVVLLDGLVASALPEIVVPEARRLRLVSLVHLPLGVAGDAACRAREYAVLLASRRIVTTSLWSRQWLLDAYASLEAELVHVVHPGVDPAPVVSWCREGSRMLCVGAVTRTKGQDVMVQALAQLTEYEWSCRCVGSLAVDEVYAGQARALAGSPQLAGRITWAGPRGATELDADYADADLVVVPSTTEAYGMVVTEALARGLPVVGSAVGGVPEALGAPAIGPLPGLLVPAGDAAALADALRGWLTNADLRSSLRELALRRRCTLTDWSATTARVSRVLSQVAT